MANITERNGKFHVRVYRKEGAVCKSFHLRKDALVWARRTEADIQAGRWKPAQSTSDLTLREALVRYSRDVTITKKGSTQETCVIGAIAREPLTGRPLTSIRPADIARLRDDWLKSRAPATVRRRLAILSHCFEIARKEWSIDVANPLLAIRKPTVANGRSRRLREGELEAVLAATASAVLAPVARLALETAMRLSEIVGLRRTDVDLAVRVVTLRDTKNGSARAVPLSPAAIRILETLPRRLDGFLFGVDGPSVTRAWTRGVKRARRFHERECLSEGRPCEQGYLVDLHFHDLRHEATSRLFENGLFSTMEVAGITGHKTLQMLSRYTHLNASRLADKLAQLPNRN